MKENAEMNEGVDRFMAFIFAVEEACAGHDKEYEFACPLCGGKARAYKTSYNGHHRGICEGCGIKMVE